MRKLLLLLTLLLPSVLLLSAHGQEATGGIVFSRARQFRIPFDAGAGTGRLRQLQLFVSTDQGRTWQPSTTAPPDQGHFRYTSDRDGFFWFTVQTQDLDNRLYPPAMDGAQPSLKVVVDTQAPIVSLQPLTASGGQVGVSWEIRDENLDLSMAEAAKLEYRPGGTTSWLPLPMKPGANQYFWNPGNGGSVEVRLQARDRAGNAAEAVTNVNSGQGIAQGPGQGNSGFVQAPINPDQTQSQAGRTAELGSPAPENRRLVNNKRVNLNFDLTDVGPSGWSSVDLWYTMDGRSWNKYSSLAENSQSKNFTWDVSAEGVYGITLVARSGVGLGERPPQTGDRPQIWIEVDITKPVVQLQKVEVGIGAEKGKMSIMWSARDKNLAREPITLSYADRLDGQWSRIAEKLPNSGRHIWSLPKELPWQFYVRVEALDLAGNIGEDTTESMVKVDLAHPKVKILTVEPGAK